MARLGESHGVCVVLVPGPAHLGAASLDPEGWSVLATAHGILKELSHRERDFRTGTSLPHLNGQFVINITSPVQTFATFGVDEGLVATRGHHYNAIVGHFLSFCFNFAMFDLRNLEDLNLSVGSLIKNYFLNY